MQIIINFKEIDFTVCSESHAPVQNIRGAEN